MDSEGSSPLVSLALDGIARLDGDDAKEDALKTLGNVLAGTTFTPELAEIAFERLLRLSLSLGAPWTRSRAFLDACASIGCSRAPRDVRARILERALALADDAETPLERIERACAATEALGALRHDEQVVESLENLGAEAAALGDPRARGRTLTRIAIAIGEAGETGRAVKLLDHLEPSSARSRAFAQIAGQMHAAGDVDDASALLDAAVGEIRGEAESYEQALALRAVLECLIETGAVAGARGAETGVVVGAHGVDTVLGIIDGLHDARFKKDAILGAIEALPAAALDPLQVSELVLRIRASLDRVEETYTRAPLLGELAIALAARGDVQGAARALDGVLKIAAASDPGELVDALGDPEAALPIPKILSALASEGDPRVVHEFAMHALAMVRGLDEPATIASILRHSAHLFASPALPYDSRIALLERALWVAQNLRSPDHCVEAVTSVANALSLAGATERGDALFAGLCIAIDPRRARKAHLERAIALTRLGRVPDARSELVAAAELPGGDAWHAIEELAQACARCGFIGDLLEVLARVEPERQLEARTQVADVLAESAYLDPALRVIGLESIAGKAEPPLSDTVAVLVEEVKLVEKMGDPGEILARGFVRTGAMPERSAAAALEQQLVGALLDRLRRDEA